MYALKNTETAKTKKLLTDRREDYMAVKLTTGETRVVHRNLGKSLVKKGAAEEIKTEIDDASRVRAKRAADKEKAQKAANA